MASKDTPGPLAAAVVTALHGRGSSSKFTAGQYFGLVTKKDRVSKFRDVDHFTDILALEQAGIEEAADRRARVRCSMFVLHACCA